jgi:hypothetical protein
MISVQLLLAYQSPLKPDQENPCLSEELTASSIQACNFSLPPSHPSTSTDKRHTSPLKEKYTKMGKET